MQRQSRLPDGRVVMIIVPGENRISLSNIEDIRFDLTRAMTAAFFFSFFSSFLNEQIRLKEYRCCDQQGNCCVASFDHFSRRRFKSSRIPMYETVFNRCSGSPDYLMEEL